MKSLQPRPPVAPPEQLQPEEERTAPLDTYQSSLDAELRHLEGFLDSWMRRLENRLDDVVAHVAPMATAFAQAPRSPRCGSPPMSPTRSRDQGARLVSRAAAAAAAASRGAAAQETPRGSTPRGEPSPRSETPWGLQPPGISSSSSTDDPDPVVTTITSLASSGGKIERRTRKLKTLSEWGSVITERASSVQLRRASTAEQIEKHWLYLENSSSAGRAGSFAHSIVSQKWFDFAITLVVLLSAIVVGVQIDYEATVGGELRALDYVEYVCTGIFTMEIGLRIRAYGMKFLCGQKERPMFLIDVILVAAAWVDIILSSLYSVEGETPNSVITKIIKVVRIGRLVRLVRTIRVLSELRVMVSMIFGTLRSLMWLFFILLGFCYLFGLVLTQGASAHLRANQMDPESEESMVEAFGSLFRTMYSLFKSMTGGRNWGEVADVIAPAGWVYSFLVGLYMFINLFSVLNIVTGVFVDGAIELSNRDRSMMITKQAKKRTAFVQHLLQLLRDMDTSGDGEITRDEFLSSFARPDVKEYMQALSIDLDDAHKMFTLLDRDDSGTVGLMEFVQGMDKMRGEAKSSDVHFLTMQCEQIADMMSRALSIPRKSLTHPVAEDVFSAVLSDRSSKGSVEPV